MSQNEESSYDNGIVDDDESEVGRNEADPDKREEIDCANSGFNTDGGSRPFDGYYNSN